MNPAGMPAQDRWVAAGYPPHHDCAIVAACCHSGIVRREGDAARALRVPSEDRARSARTDIPETNRAVNARRADGPAVRRESQACHPSKMTPGGRYLTPCRDIPDMHLSIVASGC